MKAIGLEDVIAAVSTPPGSGGISIIRVSGQGAIDLCDKIFHSPKNKKLSALGTHRIVYGEIVDEGRTLDQVLVSVMLAPHTYTCEDVVEVNCHGGSLVTAKILECILKNGARLAEPGEFTKRAFLNGRIDLSQAEAVMDMIQAKTELSRRAAESQLEGQLKKEVSILRDQLLDMIAGIEAAIDYPDMDIEEETYESQMAGCQTLISKIEGLVASTERGKILQEGIKAVILGKPNVGKSSLLNWFLKEERAIVTDIPGTTRDTVEEYVNLDGIPLKIIDTAGIRSTDDRVEQIGVEKSKRMAEEADIILFVADGSTALTEEDKEILQFIHSKKSIVLLNKEDLGKVSGIESEIIEYIPLENIIGLSILQNKGMEKLVSTIKDMFFGGALEQQEATAIGNARHMTALELAKAALKRAINTIETRMPEDFISMDLQEANLYLGQITGDSVDGEIIDRVFSRFCLGK